MKHPRNHPPSAWPLLFGAMVLLQAPFVRGAAGDPEDAHFSFSQQDGRTIVRWDAGTGGVQLKHTSDFKKGSWTDLPAAMARDGSWWAESALTGSRGFFSLVPAAAPVTPKDVQVSMTGKDFRIEWTPAPDACSYCVYVSTVPLAGPGQAEKVLEAGMASTVEVSGLTPGVRYYISVVAKNKSGESAPSELVNGVFGPSGPVSGFVAYAFQSQQSEPFPICAPQVKVTLFRASGPSGGPPLEVISDADGRFFFPSVPVGSYTISWVTPEGDQGTEGKPRTVDTQGLSLNPLAIPGKPESLHGRVRLGDGSTAGMDDDLWDLHYRAEVIVLDKTGKELSRTKADPKGGYAMPPAEQNAYPLTIKASYQDLSVTREITKIPEKGAPPPMEELTILQKPPQLKRLSAWQNGRETKRILPDVPVEFRAEVDNPDQLPTKLRWHAQEEGTPRKAAKDRPEFTWGKIKTTEGIRSAGIKVRVNVSDLVSSSYINQIIIELFGAPSGEDCWTGWVGGWDPALPDVIAPVHPATLSLKNFDFYDGAYHESSVSALTRNSAGYFETGFDLIGYSSYTHLKVNAPGYMPFLWTFPGRLPEEVMIPLVKSINTSHTYTGDQLVISRSGSPVVVIQAGGLQRADGSPFTSGQVQVSTAVFDPLVRQPFPPGAWITTDVSGDQVADPQACMWFEVRDAANALLIPVNDNLVFTISNSTNVSFLENRINAYRQNETTTFFHRADTATKSPGQTQFVLPITKDGFYMLARPSAPHYLTLRSDRTLNYPFDVLIGTSFFPQTLRNSYTEGGVYVAQNADVRVRVLDLRQAPGLHFADPTTSTPPTPAFVKSVIFDRTVATNAPSGYTEVPLTLGQAIPGLIRPGAVRVTDLDGEEHFLSRTLNTPGAGRESIFADQAREFGADDYYDEINAPRGIYEWKALNGFPNRFGDPLPGVLASDYATAYYYNMADLGLARAQTMRIKRGADGLDDVAFYVTNYASLEDARCGRRAIATVAMDYAYRADDTGGMDRHTRFYVYGSTGDLSRGADLDGQGVKHVPGLCITCHGGSHFREGGSGNLGSRFLPFDLEAYTYHPAWGVQKGEFAKMNAGVLKTIDEGAAVTDIGKLILAWYGNAIPTTNPAVFQANYIPPGWPTPGLYGAFKVGCRVCHISRDAAPSVQFGTEAEFGGYGYQLCTGLVMPHTQRTWGALWGTKASRNLGNTSVTDLPALLHLNDGGTGGCPALGR